MLKKEYDIFRTLRLPHPSTTYLGIKCTPFAHEDLETWRDSLRGGIKYLHAPTNLIIKGAVDDIWINTNNQLHIVDEKLESLIEPQILIEISAFKEIVTIMRQSGTAFPLIREPRLVARDIHR